MREKKHKGTPMDVFCQIGCQHLVIHLESKHAELINNHPIPSVGQVPPVVRYAGGPHDGAPAPRPRLRSRGRFWHSTQELGSFPGAHGLVGRAGLRPRRGFALFEEGKHQCSGALGIWELLKEIYNLARTPSASGPLPKSPMLLLQHLQIAGHQVTEWAWCFVTIFCSSVQSIHRSINRSINVCCEVARWLQDTLATCELKHGPLAACARARLGCSFNASTAS